MFVECVIKHPIVASQCIPTKQEPIFVLLLPVDIIIVSTRLKGVYSIIPVPVTPHSQFSGTFFRLKSALIDIITLWCGSNCLFSLLFHDKFETYSSKDHFLCCFWTQSDRDRYNYRVYWNNFAFRLFQALSWNNRLVDKYGFLPGIRLCLDMNWTLYSDEGHSRWRSSKWVHETFKAELNFSMF